MKVLVSTSTFGEFDETPLRKLKQNGFEVVVNPYGRKLQPQESIGLMRDIDGIIAGTEPLNSDILKRANRLKVISRLGVGLDNVDLIAAKQLGIHVASTPAAPTEAVAELTLGLMIVLARRVVEADHAIRNGSWKPLMGVLLTGKTLGIVGLGRIGKRVAELAQPLSMSILAYEPFADGPFVTKYQIGLVSLSELFSQADIVSLHIPLLPETRGLVSRELFALMKPTALLINTCRGEVVDEAALLQAVESNRLAGAALDVYNEEPYRGPMKQNSRIILSAHMGSYAKEARIQMEHEAVENLIRLLTAVAEPGRV
jgi:D-3-phosphoglycerate dehydrogenase